MLLTLSFDAKSQDCEVGEEEFVLNLFDSWGDGWDHGSGHLVTIDDIDYGGLEFVELTTLILRRLLMQF
ncbi:hypothetical protein N9Y89_01495 [bacterium]|nr:hypothetical protein [bacterium]